MQVALLANGTRDMRFRPYIEFEETGKSVYLADPNGDSFYHGLYDGPQPLCGSWLSIYHQYPSKIPIKTISGNGRLQSYNYSPTKTTYTLY